MILHGHTRKFCHEIFHEQKIQSVLSSNFSVKLHTSTYHTFPSNLSISADNRSISEPNWSLLYTTPPLPAVAAVEEAQLSKVNNVTKKNNHFP